MHNIDRLIHLDPIRRIELAWGADCPAEHEDVEEVIAELKHLRAERVSSKIGW